MDGFEGEGRRYLLYGFAVLFAVGFGVVAWVSVQRAGSAGEVATSVPVVFPSVESAEPTALPPPEPSPTGVVTPTFSPSPSPTPVVATEAETVLFEGGPARGPWQQLGTVAEITHPGAPLSARYSYENFWSDPEEENQPDALWDQLVVEVTEQLVELGEPVDRPVFGGAPGTEHFNSFGGVADVYSWEFTAQWSAVVHDDDEVKAAYFWYLISFDGDVLAASEPFMLVEDGQRTSEDNARDNAAGIRAWAEEMGATGCTTC